MAVIPDFKSSTLMTFLKRNIEPGSIVYTDGLKSLTGLREAGFKPPAIASRIAEGRQVSSSPGRPGHWESAAVANLG